jgi:uncharacterized protein
MADTLTTTQVNFLKALLDKVQHLSAKATLQQYQLGTSANIQRIKKALTEKEIIDTHQNTLFFLDPVYAHWLKEFYFLH